MKIVRIYLLFTLLFSSLLITQTEKKEIKIEDAKLWRYHQTTLSENGKWYSVKYLLIEKPEQANKKADKKDKTEKGFDKKDIELYGKDAMTNVLYIRNIKSKKEYLIPKGARPLFSPKSDWVAYNIIPEKKKGDKKPIRKTIELKNLKTGNTRKWESNASFKFTKDGKYFITSDKKSVAILCLKNLTEYYIGNVGEYIIPKDENYMIYTIKTDDLRGNGIYLYNLKSNITKMLLTGNFVYSNLALNKKKTAISALKYSISKKDKKPENINLLTITNFNSADKKITEYKSANMKGLAENMQIQMGNISWSNDNSRIFLNIEKKEDSKENNKNDAGKKPKEKSTMDIWHWKDKKLVSQQMVESKRKREVYKAVFNLKSKKLTQLTSEELQRISFARETDLWAIGFDNRNYISDWDVRKNDIYRVDLRTGKKNLILKKYDGRVNISPDGKNVIFWKDGHYWLYKFENNQLKNISENLSVSFINKENDHFGSTPDYGFVGWVNNKKSIIVNHKLDLWQLPLNSKGKAKNLTEKVRGNTNIRFRFNDTRFTSKPEMKDRYINLKKSNLISAFDIKTKYAGFYELEDGDLKKLIFEPASFGNSRWNSGITKAKNADVYLYKFGTYEKYPESYISDMDFSNSIKITNTNPQQKNYLWGKRILVNYKNDDGIELQGILSIPNSYKTGEKLPMIVHTYEKLSDGLFYYSTPSIRGSGVSEMLYVSAGYLYFQPDIHFNIGSPHSDMHKCIDAALTKVIEMGYVDEKHIGYIGHSFGGHAAMYISTQKNKFAAIVGGAGVSNLVQGFDIDIVRDGTNEQDYYMTGQGRLGVNPIDGLEKYIHESAVFNAKNMNTPLLIYHGTADNVVQWEHSFGFYNILRFFKKPVIFLSFKGEGHGIRGKANRLELQLRLKEFFDNKLKGVKAADWIENGRPFKAEKDSKNKKKKRTVPDWK